MSNIIPDISLLNIFEPKVRNNIITFCKDISKTHADIYVIMARKAACLISMLDKLSLISLQGDVISERVMDSKIEWQRYRSVIIIDDVIISGTTLYKTIEKIKVANPDIDIRLYVIGVNKDWYNDSVLEIDGKSYIQPPVRVMNNSECIRLSGDIVRMLSKFPTPYNIDFPIYNTYRLNDEDFHQVMTLPGWEISEVSPFSHSESNVFAHTFIPSQEILGFCGSFYQSDFIKNSLLKIRTYGRSRTDKQHLYHFLTIVPMIIMPQISIETLDDIFKEITRDKYQRIGSILNTASSRLRLIQFVLADVLAQKFVGIINHHLGKNDAVYREYSSLRYLFPSTVIHDVNEIADHFNGEIGTHVAFDVVNEEPADIEVHDLLDVNETLSSPFISMYYEEEIPSRQLVREHGKNVFAIPEYKSILGRLDRGISITHLSNRLGDIPNSMKKALVSAFLDRAIDEGIVVPITVSSDGKVYRAFRHGEDVQFGQLEERLCFDMLSALSKSADRTELPRLWVEKLMVLLLQLGEGEIFTPIQTNLSSYSCIRGVEKVQDVASVRFYLQGPLIVRTPTQAIIAKPYLEHNDKALWLTSYFSQSPRTPLTVSSSGMYLFDQRAYKKLSGGDMQIVVDAKKTQYAKSIGNLFGFLLSNESKKVSPSLSSDDLVMLTTSLETKNIIGAMAAEINICKNAFRSESEAGVRFVLEKVVSGQMDASAGFERIRRSAWHQAINDGIRKFSWYREHAGYAKIEEITVLLEDDLYKNIWEGFWSPNLEQYGNKEKQELIDLAIVEGLWLLCAYAYYLMLQYLVMKRENKEFLSKTIIERISYLQDVIKQHAPHIKVKEILPLLMEFHVKHHDSNYVAGCIPIIYERLTVLFNRTDKILEDCSDYFSNNLSIPSYQYYHHALYIEVEREEGLNALSTLYESISFRMRNSGQKVNTEILMIPPSGSSMCSAFHRFFIAYNEEGHSWLLQLALETITRMRGYCGVKVFFYPHLPSDCHIKVSPNAQYGFQLFNEFAISTMDSIAAVGYEENCMYEISESCNNEPVYAVNKGFSEYSVIYKEDKIIYIPNKRDYNLIKYKKMDKQESFQYVADIAIITIVDEEARAVRKGFQMEEDHIKIINGRYYDEAIFSTNGRDFRIVHTQCANQGNVSMALSVVELVRAYNPTHLVLLGIAGSIRDKINLCDVVIGNDVLYYESRKENEGGTVERRLRDFNLSFKMLNHITHYRSISEQPFVAAEGSPTQTFNLHVTPIGTGEAVIGNKLSDIRNWLLSVNGKTGAVETEAAGFSAAFNESTHNLNDILIIRGISDKADVDKDDKWRQPASDNAVKVLKDFITKIFSRA